MSAPAMQRDAVEIVLGFARTLRHAGVDATPTRVQALLTALDHLDVLDRDQVYWAGRMTLCSGPDDLAKYETAFAAYFGGRTASNKPRPQPAPRPTVVAPFGVEAPDQAGDDTGQPDDLSVQASGVEVLRHRDVASLTMQEREELRRLFALLGPRVGTRRTHRYTKARRGRVDLERTVRRMVQDGGEPGTLAFRARRVRPRRLVLLIDVSGSMAPYADSLLRFAHAAVRAAPATTEVFTIGTRLTRVTRELRRRDPDQALSAAGEAIPDWSGGTRIGEVIKAFLDRWGQRGTARGAVVVLCSDGWERGDPTLLGEQMSRLNRLAHQVVWVNPHKGKDGFAPIAGGMAAALPHLDRLVAGHSFQALEELAGVISNA